MYFYYLGDMERALMMKARGEEVFQEHRRDYENLYFADIDIKSWIGEYHLNPVGWHY